MTEEEAKTKWCPFARSHWSGVERAIDPTVSCLGSGCMSWRTVPPPPFPGVSAKVTAFIAEGKKINAIREHRLDTGLSLRGAKDALEGIFANLTTPPVPRGYCGLAGKDGAPGPPAIIAPSSTSGPSPSPAMS